MNLIRKRTTEYLNVLRSKRKKLFAAWDIHKSNVNYGVCVETKEMHDQLIKWYDACLELREEAIMNPPSEIIKHL